MEMRSSLVSSLLHEVDSSPPPGACLADAVGGHCAADGRPPRPASERFFFTFQSSTAASMGCSSSQARRASNLA